ISRWISRLYRKRLQGTSGPNGVRVNQPERHAPVDGNVRRSPSERTRRFVCVSSADARYHRAAAGRGGVAALGGELPLSGAAGAAWYELIAENVTEQRLLEHQLRQAQKMEAVGRLAGGVAHDFNNLLMFIRGHTELLLDRLRADDWHYRKVEQIQKAADRAAGLTRQLLAFSRMQVLQPKVIDLNAVVAEMGKMLPRLIGEDIELSIQVEPRLAH